MFNLHVIQAKFGDSFLLEYGSHSPKYILIDGGPKDVYKNFLKGELTNLVTTGELELVVISHVDEDHIRGILDLFMDCKNRQDNEDAWPVEIKELWHNSFAETVDDGGAITNRLQQVYSMLSQNGVAANTGIVLQGIKEGDRVRSLAIELGIDSNTQTDNNFFSLENTTDPITLDNLEFLIIGPTAENLAALKKKWDAWLRKQEEDIANGAFDIASMSDKSVPNLSSIMFLVTADGKRILFTGDGRGDFIYEGLEKRGLLRNGKMHVDVFKVPHHGSDRNIDREFFENVTANTYVISADGKHDNPDYATLTWIVEAAADASRFIELLITNETPSTKKLVRDYPPADYGYDLRFIPHGTNSKVLTL